jgi:hypothetical protein
MLCCFRHQWPSGLPIRLASTAKFYLWVGLPLRRLPLILLARKIL